MNLTGVAALIAAASFAVLWPLGRRDQPYRSGSEAAVYRDQLAEIDRDAASGLIGSSEAEAARVEISRNYSPEVPPLPIDAGLIEQVLINLLTNAAQASPPDAPITVSTRLAGPEAEIAVIDRGCGIAADKLDSDGLYAKASEQVLTATN